MADSGHVLIVEDDRDIAALVARYLERAGYTTDITGSGRDVVDRVTHRPPTAIVLDLMLPDADGLTLCRALRARTETAQVPIVMLTARAEETDRIVGLELGADDYITKPFSPRELVARVNALLRRARRDVPESQHLEYGAIVLDLRRHSVSVNGQRVHLTAKEFLLLRYFMEHRGRVVSRDRLLADIWGYDYTGGTRTVDVHVSRLREKVPALQEKLVSVRQFGYQLAE